MFYSVKPDKQSPATLSPVMLSRTSPGRTSTFRNTHAAFAPLKYGPNRNGRNGHCERIGSGNKRNRQSIRHKDVIASSWRAPLPRSSGIGNGHRVSAYQSLTTASCSRTEFGTSTPSRRMMSRNLSSILAQSTRSTLNGRSDSPRPSAKAEVTSGDRGSSPMMARSRSEYSFAVQVARDPKASTRRSGTCCRRTSLTMAQWSGRRSRCGDRLAHARRSRNLSRRQIDSSMKRGMPLTTSIAMSSS